MLYRIATLFVLLISSPLWAAQPPQVLRDSPENEACIVRMPDDELRIFYVLRPGGGEIHSISSRDNGQTWSEPRQEFKLPGSAYYALEVTFDRHGELQCVFHIVGKGDKGHNGRHYDVYHIKTSNGRQKWGESKRILEGYVGSLCGFIKLKNGRLLLTISPAVPERSKPPASGVDYGWHDVIAMWSDDDGETWHTGEDRLKVAQDNRRGRTRYGGVEPMAIEMLDGRVWMLVRTKMGTLYESYSTDNGTTWPALKPSNFISSDSPAGACRLKDGRLVLFFNACQRHNDLKSYAIGGRETLHAAISADDGKTWQGFREVLHDLSGEGKGDRGTAYPSAVQAADGRIILASGQGEHRRKLVAIDPDWLTETSAVAQHWITYEGVGATTDGAKLTVTKPEAAKQAGAVWNFPMMKAGQLTMRLQMNPGSAGAIVSLANHFSPISDTLADENALASIKLDKLDDGKPHDVVLTWGADEVQVTIDGKPAKRVAMKKSPFGANYLRVRSAAAETDLKGFVIESAKASATGAVAAAPAAGGAKVVCLGDSITRGVRRGMTADQTFVHALAMATGVEVINAGVGGNRTDQALERLSRDVLQHRPKVVTIMFGTNDSCYDAGKTSPRLPLEQYEKNLQSIVEQVQGAGAIAVVMTPPPLGRAWLKGRNPIYTEKGENFALAGYAAVARRVAKETNSPLVDHFASWQGKDIDSLLGDGCHPNPEGHAVMAEAILAVIKPLLGGSPAFQQVAGPQSGGAVLEMQWPSKPENHWATCPSVLKIGDTYQMYYSSFYAPEPGAGGIWRATSFDGVTWTIDNAGQPVLSPGKQGAFDAAQVFSPEVLHDGQKYLMWYTGASGEKHKNILYYRIGLATSTDGIHWQRANDGKPVLDVGPAGAPDEVQSATPSVLKTDTGYRMWYAAWGPTANHVICAATSPDGITWTRENDGKPVDGLQPSIAFGQGVARVGERYLMLYMALHATPDLYAAESRDGLSWSMLNGGKPVILAGEKGRFDVDIAAQPFVMVDGGKLRAWYTGFQRQPGGLAKWQVRIGLAEAELQ